MCQFDQPSLFNMQQGRYSPSTAKVVDLDELTAYARFVAGEPEVRRTAAGFIGFGSTLPGNRVLFAVDTHYDTRVVEAVARALREKGAKVDIVIVDVGPDREFDELDEIRVVMRRRPWHEEPRRWEGVPWVEDLAKRNKYDLLIHGKGGGIPESSHRHEAFPWLGVEHFLSKATVFPRDVHTLINEKMWFPVWDECKGGNIHVTDPEGTDLTYTLWEEYFDGSRPVFTRTPMWGHLMAHPSTPIIPKADAAGIAAGTTSHFSKPFTRIELEVEQGLVVKLRGGGSYGAAWRDYWEESKSIQYPCFPRPGLFWLWEVAIGTNPKIMRPSNIHRLASGGAEWERRHSGVIHLGFGTMWRAPEEVWAGENNILYGHLHVHLLFPTVVVKAKNGKEFVLVDRGRLPVLDDPEVRKLASKYGDPDDLLEEDWIPQIPGINIPGSYEDYAKNPAAWIYSHR